MRLAKPAARSPSRRSRLMLLSAALSTGMIGGVWAQADMAPSPLPGDAMAPVPEMNGTMAPGTQTPFMAGLEPPVGFSAGGSADLSERYVSNALGVGRASGVATGGDYDTRLRLSLYARDHTPRFDGDLQYTLGADAFANRPSLDRLSNFLTALASVSLIPDRLLVSARAFAMPVLVNSLGPIAAEEDRPVATTSTSGFRNTYGLTVSPELLFRLGNFATSTTTLSEGYISFSRPRGPVIPQFIPGQTPPQEVTTTSLTQHFASGTDFDRLNWGVTGTASKTTRPGGDMKVASGTADMKYAVSREFAVLGTAGYQSITTAQQLSHHLVGPTALAGFQLTLGPDFELSAEAGQQFNFPSYMGDLHWQIGPFTNLTGSLTDSIRTPGQRLLGGLDSLGVDNGGNFFDTSFGSSPSFGSGFNPVPLDHAPINSSISRYRSATLSLVHDSDIAQFRLTAFRTLVNRLTVEIGIPTVTSTGATFTISRNVNPNLTGDIDLTYRRQELLGGEHTVYSTRLNFNYMFSMLTSAYLRFAYMRRLTDAALVAATSPLSSSTSDASVIIGIRREF